MAPRKSTTDATPAKIAPAPAPAATSTADVPIELLIQKRDALVTALSQLSHAAQEVSWASIEYFNLQHPGLTGTRPPPTAAYAQIAPRAQSIANALESGPAAATTPAAAPAEEEKGKRKKKEQKKPRDPNEPKRPVTAYFLFLSNARGQLQNDMKDATPKDIQNEAVTRWYAMTDAEKQPYKDLYEANFAQWKIDMEAYKAKKEAEGGVTTIAEEPATTTAATTTTAAPAATTTAEEEDTDAEEEEERPSKIAKTTPPAEKSGGRASRTKSTPKKTEKKSKESGRSNERKKKDTVKDTANKDVAADTPSKKDDSKRKRKRKA